MGEKFCQAIKMLKINQTEMFEMKNSESENEMESLSNKPGDTDEYLS